MLHHAARDDYRYEFQVATTTGGGAGRGNGGCGSIAECGSDHERLGKIVEMKYFGGMTENEIAEVMELSLRTVQRDWEKARLFPSASLQQKDI
jgi:hypothetical protein